jgi:DNA-binding CsgD family transcriptional regulator
LARSVLATPQDLGGGGNLVERLLERQEALGELSALARAVGGGSGRVVLLRGEAGIGKSTLITRFIAGLDGSVHVLMGWCDPLATPRPLGPLLDALSGFGPTAAGALDAAIQSGDTGALYRRLLGIVRDGRRWVWVIEDAHWADGATLDLIRFFARRIGSLPLLMVISYRDDEIERDHPLSVALGDVATCAAVSRIGLEPLSRDAVAVLATGTGVNADDLHHLTGGNPFYVTEILAGGTDALYRDVLPRSVSEAVWGRLGRLSAAARETAQAVAVCGPRAVAALVQEVCPSAASALNECLDAGVLVTEAEAVGFRHELARRATMNRIPDHRRRMWHKRALAVLAQSPIDPNSLGALAFHADQAGNAHAVIEYAPAAAEQAAALGANREAADLYALTLRHTDLIPADQKVIWLEQHGFASYACGLGQAAVASWQEATTLRHMMGDTLSESDDLRWMSHQLITDGRVAEAADAGLAALELVQHAGACTQLAWSLVNMAELAVYGFDPAAADYAVRAITVGEQLGDEAAVLRARGVAALVSVLCDNTGWDELEAAWRDAMIHDARGEQAGLLGADLCTAAVLYYDLHRADRYIPEVLGYCRQRDLFVFEAFVIGLSAMVAMHRGDWVHARSAAEDLLTRPGLPALHRILARRTLTTIHARRGEQPMAPLRDDIAARSELDGSRFFPVWAVRAEAAWLAGDDDAAIGEAESALASVAADQDPWLLWQLRRWAQLPAGTPTFEPVDNPVNPFQLEVSGDWRGATDAWMGRGCPYEAAIAQLGGDITAVESALATFRRLGARAAARRARQRLTALRGSPLRGRSADTRADPDGLTRREREVLELLAAGRSDAEIAAALHISPKTAGTHVSSILVKLGVANRTQAASHAHRRQTSDA